MVKPRFSLPLPPLWHQFSRETRTRILLLYALLMLLLTGLSIPVFRYLLFRQIDRRVRADLNRERAAFLESYRIWEETPNQTTDDLKAFVDEHMKEKRPEDDNFHIVLIDGELYRSSPSYLIAPLQSGSRLFGDWQTVTTFTRGTEPSEDPEIGDILYKAEPLKVDGQQKGVYVVAHSAAGERQESLVGIYLFTWMIVAVVALALVLAWIGAGRLMAPIQVLSKTARSISDSDLTGRIPSIQGSSELADLADTFNAMMNRIQQAFDSQRAFINDAGHELRTPITIIRGHLELLDDDPHERQETVELVIDELDRMGRLVNDMILLAKSERADFLQLETIEISSLTEDLFAKAQTLAERNWVLKIESRGNMVGDRQRLTGALLNLLRNATQHTEADDTIELGCRVTAQAAHYHKPFMGKQLTGKQLTGREFTSTQVQFWVKDTGQGISTDEQQRIFGRFSRGHHRTRHSEGSGLGLAIVSAIVDAHSGRIELVSQLGKGSTFWLNLPIDPR